MKRKILGFGSLILPSYADIKYSPIYILLSYWLGGPIAMYISYIHSSFTFHILRRKGTTFALVRAVGTTEYVIGFMLL